MLYFYYFSHYYCFFALFRTSVIASWYFHFIDLDFGVFAEKTDYFVGKSLPLVRHQS